MSMQQAVIQSRSAVNAVRLLGRFYEREQHRLGLRPGSPAQKSEPRSSRHVAAQTQSSSSSTSPSSSIASSSSSTRPPFRLTLKSVHKKSPMSQFKSFRKIARSLPWTESNSPFISESMPFPRSSEAASTGIDTQGQASPSFLSTNGRRRVYSTPLYKARQQKKLIRAAMRVSPGQQPVQNLLPFVPVKAPETTEEEAINKLRQNLTKPTAGPYKGRPGREFKLHKWERTQPARIADRKARMESMPKRIEDYNKARIAAKTTDKATLPF
ncbi:hypothetical protein EMMF5_000648 [Cystobasidiomycetes sp. EMM_F5]